MALAALISFGVAPAIDAQELRSPSGSIMARIDNDGVVRDSSGNRKGRIESDGVVRNASGNRIGKVESDGTVRDSSGSRLGTARNIRREYAAAVFFFYF